MRSLRYFQLEVGGKYLPRLTNSVANFWLHLCWGGPATTMILQSVTFARFILVVLFVCFALYFSFLFTFYVLVFSASTIIAMKKSPRIKSESYCENLDLIDCGQIVTDG